jgi:hypothetical protein
MAHINKLIFLIFLILGIFACSPRELRYINSGNYNEVPFKTVTIWIDEGIVASDTVLIKAAITEWNYALNGYIKLNVNPVPFSESRHDFREIYLAGDWLISSISGYDKLTHERDKRLKRGTWVLAFVDEIGGNRINLVMDRVSNNQITGLILHEVGHLLGSKHVGTNLMYYMFNSSGYICIDYDTIEGVARAQHLRAGNLNYCD